MSRPVRNSILVAIGLIWLMGPVEAGTFIRGMLDSASLFLRSLAG